MSQKILATKYLGGHSDLLAGVLVVKTVEEWKQVIPTRIDLTVMMLIFPDAHASYLTREPSAGM